MFLIVSGLVHAQPIKIGELNSYKAQPSFLEHYRKGWQLALEEVNVAGGLLGRPVEVISRDDQGNPGDAVRVAEDLVVRERVDLLFGTFLSHVGLAVADFAKQRKVLFLASEPLTDKITWQNGNRYTFRLAPSTYMQVAMLVREAAKLRRKRWAIVYPNYEYGQSASETFKRLLRAEQPDVQFVVEQSPALGRIDAGPTVQAISDRKPDAIFNVLFGPDLAKFVREGQTRALFNGRSVVSILSGWPEYLEPLREDAPEGWIVTAYPWYSIETADHKKFVSAYTRRWNDHPRLGSVIGYASIKSIAAAIKRAGSTETEKLVGAFAELPVDTPLGPVIYRRIDHQSTMGTYVGTTSVSGGLGVVTNHSYIDGKAVMPPDADVRRWRPSD
ncbi:ABC transporter substrate-binding protein [Rhizobacter sp. Root404]|uniref:ABC transporter substrate-binding protein n=1 Tax=Rhizobacter sp. Root404 TaxID=1736528 RepID=UPI0009EA0AD8|nr:ABC transporter substrate-binding protein [Rhizobacter sp. Root404]